MNTTPDNSRAMLSNQLSSRADERGAALATAILMLGLLSAIALTVLAVVQTETRVAGSDLCRTQSFYAASAGIEKMTSDFGLLFAKSSVTTPAQLNAIALLSPDLSSEGFTFTQSMAKDQATLDEMRLTQGIGPTIAPTVSVPKGPLVGLTATVTPYLLTTTATSACAQVTLERRMNNYLVPIFQFGMFSDEDMEIHPGVLFTFNGRVHANGNLYLSGIVTFEDKVTTASEVVRDVLRNSNAAPGTAGASTGSSTAAQNIVTFDSGTLNIATPTGTIGTAATNCLAVAARCASVIQGPNVGGSNPNSPTGVINADWKTNSVAKFGGQLLTGSTGVAPLKLPLQLDDNPTREIIKRRTPNDNATLQNSRYHSKAEIRILLDDEGAGADLARSAANPLNGDGTTNAGVDLSTFTPVVLPNVLNRVNDSGVVNAADIAAPIQQQQNLSPVAAVTVRGVHPATPHFTITNATNISGVNIIITTATAHGFGIPTATLEVFISGVAGQTRANNTAGNNTWTATVIDATHFSINKTGGGVGFAYTGGGIVYSFTALKKSGATVIPSGAGLSGHILIQIVDANGVARDVTTQILSMGVTEGEPNAIVTLQRPLWAAFTQGSRDASGGNNNLKYIMDNSNWGADGEINTAPTQDANGYLTNITNDAADRSDNPWALDPANFTASMWNSIVPINVYNVREGVIKSTLERNTIYERGMTSAIELNMKNLARWVDGAYDANLLNGTGAISANIASPDGYIVYVSDRRGDKIKPEVDSTNAIVQMTNGMCDNEDIYGFNQANGDVPDPGEDVIDFKAKKGTLQKDVTELPDPNVLLPNASAVVTLFAARTTRANYVAAWKNPTNYFRRAVRLFNGEDMRTSMAGTKLSANKGITIASENMVYIWGNYNTTGINVAPAAGISSLNDTGEASHYCPGAGCTAATDRQIPASIVCDAFFTLSKTWFDSEAAIYPDLVASRPADRSLGGNVTWETSVRAGIIAGNNLSALSALGTGVDQGNYSATNSSNESRLNGGMHNFPRFLENWGARFNFVGSLIPLFHSTQALGPYNAASSIYDPPLRNWAFDITFRVQDRLPPGTPQFQYIEPTAFRQILY